MIENLVDPVLPDLLAAVRERDRRAAAAAARRPLASSSSSGVAPRRGRRRDRRRPGDAAGALELGPIPLRWWASPALAAADPLPEPLPLVAYDPPCGLRDLALRAARRARPRRTLITAESPHLSGVHAAVRNGLGYALLAAGGDGLRAVAHGPLATTIAARLWLLLATGQRALAAPLRAALRREMATDGVRQAAA